MQIKLLSIMIYKSYHLVFTEGILNRKNFIPFSIVTWYNENNVGNTYTTILLQCCKIERETVAWL